MRIRLPMLQRSCGECRECCTAMAVGEIGKGWYEKCARLSESGCDIYGSHPTSCKDYHCLWLDGWGGEDDRPDKLGVIAGYGLFPHEGEHLPAVILVPTKAGVEITDHEEWIWGNILKDAGRGYGHPQGPPVLITQYPFSVEPYGCSTQQHVICRGIPDNVVREAYRLAFPPLTPKQRKKARRQARQRGKKHRR
jgi:hypothetical protein